MKAVLELAKRFLFEIICSVCAAAGIALIFLGLGGMSNVKSKMDEAYSIKTSIASMGGANPINNEAVELAQRRIDAINAADAEAMAFVTSMNYREPLVPEAFPNADDAAKGKAFQQAYRKELFNWLRILNAGDIPTDDMIRQEQDLIDAEKPVDELLGADPDKQSSRDEEDEGDSLRKNAEVRAAVRNAKSISCYATLDSFQESEVSRPDGPMFRSTPPSQEDMWHAQLEVWIQRSIVDAISSVNRQAEEKIKEQYPEAEAWVGNLPVKELTAIQTTTYYITDADDGASRGGSKDRPAPPGSYTSVFTGNKSGKLYELMQFTVKLVVDARDIPGVVAGLCQNNFHTPLKVEYEAIPPNVELVDKIYGDDPVVSITIDFETVFFFDLYGPLMPDEILKELNKKRPVVEEGEGAKTDNA